MVRTGLEEEAVRFLRKARKMSPAEARMRVARIRTELGMI